MIDAPHLEIQNLVTNDQVELINEQSFKWLGRHDNVINSGGVKLHPEYLESRLSGKLKQPFFFAGLQDDQLGERLVLVVEGSKTEIDFSSFSKIERPKEVHFLKQFDYTETGKIQRSKTLKQLSNA